MNPRRSLVRKMVYLAAMVPLLLLLYALSQPASPESRSGRGSPGGLLVQLREKHGLSQAQIGQIDPASETIKLVTLGMRGVAADILWKKANDYKMKKDWANLGATLNQIIKVQPNFPGVWRFQGWNLSYNVSVEFDDYRQRYRWVIKGIEFLQKGIEYNEHEPMLVWDVGWFIGQKIGRADEHKQYRRLFKEDDDFHGSRPVALRDNWLVGKEWFRKSEALVDAGAMIKSTPVIFRSNAPMCQMNFGEAIEKEGTFGEVAKRAWKGAADEWHQFGTLDIPAPEAPGGIIHLNDTELHAQEVQRLAQKLDELAPGVRQEMFNEKKAKLAEVQRQAIDLPATQRTANQQRIVDALKSELQVPHDEVARRVTGPHRKEAIKLAKLASDQEELIASIDRRRSEVNFDYWRLRAEFEQTEDAVAARMLIYEANQAFRATDLMPARQKYEQGLLTWRKALDKFPALLANENMEKEVLDVVEYYRHVLEQLDMEFPKDFIFQDFIQRHEKPDSE